jgi:hypothetical protein
MTNRAKLHEKARKILALGEQGWFVDAITDLLVRVDADARKEANEEIEALSKALADGNDGCLALEKKLDRAKDLILACKEWLKAQPELDDAGESLQSQCYDMLAEKWAPSPPHACCSCPACVPDKPLFSEE